MQIIYCVLNRSSAEKGIPKASNERMHHSIPHRFQEKMAVHPTKCASCFDGIQFGRTIARCEGWFAKILLHSSKGLPPYRSL